ncbi:MAG: V-type ATP synthase subunit I [Clostridia bacterium]|nr:V-type ATP synthase subunit I [Clostridia bacterium]
MAIVEMRKLHLVAMAYDKDAILNALGKTGAAEVTNCSQSDYAQPMTAGADELKEYLSSVEAALSALSAQIEAQEKATGKKSDVLKDGFDVTFSDFMAAESMRAHADETVAKINALTDEKNRLKNELSKLARAIATAEIYKTLDKPLSYYSDTAKTRVRLGTVSISVKDGVLTALLEEELCAAEVLAQDSETALLIVVSHKSVSAKTDGVLSAFGFADHPYDGARSGAQIYADFIEEESALKTALRENGHSMYALKSEIKPLKIYCDYLSFTLEKQLLSEKMRATDKTFLLEAYVPKTAEETVKEAILNTSGAVFIEFSDPLDTDEPPTLLKNNGVVDSFEPITNTYSPPNYREFDPNAVMAFFYSLFMGFIIGDWGYGLLMALGGGFLWWKNRKRPTGLSRLAGSFACGGIFALFWGAIFNSFFGAALFPTTVMPNPQDGKCLFVGIQIPSVLFFAMLVGVVHLCAAYVCKAMQCFFRKEIWDGILDGIVWALFSVGVIILLVGFVEFSPTIDPDYSLIFKGADYGLMEIGGIIAGGTLLIAVVTAGRKEKFIGTFTKGFGTLYGIINYVSDILSYARLYGLMLSGAVIAGIISGYGVDFLTGGNALFAVLGVVILIVGHAFNLVMNLLGAYIHDARLQYVEFYGKFYEGEGELFAPIGAKRKYIRLTGVGENR